MTNARAHAPAPAFKNTDPPEPHVRLRPVDVAAGLVALVLAVGLVVLAALGRDIPTVMPVLLGQIVTYYFGVARTT